MLLSHKKEGNLASCDDMDEPRGCYANNDQIIWSEKDKYCMFLLICRI